MNLTRAVISVVLAALLAAGCREEAKAPPAPVTMSAEALGHFCQMNLAEHPGPKAQVHLDGLPAPLFFSQVRDAVAYQRMPEQSHAIRAVYVSDMGRAASWDRPGVDNWVAADKAVYVVGSAIAGGMGAKELVPFGDRTKAVAFTAANGGEIKSLSEIPDSLVLAPADVALDTDGNYVPPPTGARGQH